ncbi:MAG TPA: HAMP domain-containing sensor histidine kinase [Trueperaceae bacterium]
MNRALERTKPVRFSLSLRARIALAIAALAALPNALLAVGTLLPSLGGGVANELWLAALVWAVAVVGLSALVGYFASRELLAPLTRLSRDVASLPSTADRLATARLAPGEAEPAEVRAVRDAFNRLLGRIELEHSHRSAFIATLMHDLKTPLIATSHLLEVIRDRDDLGRDERVDLADRLLRENHALVTLMQKLVDAHKFDREEVPLSREQLKVETVAKRVIARLAPLAAERGVELHVEGGANAYADPAELERALYNLISNAVRYARSSITVEVFAGLVRIADDGPGLPAPLERLAQPFNEQPVEISGTRYSAGSAGLGLFIARRILESHGGRLVTESTGPRGTALLAYLGSDRR